MIVAYRNGSPVRLDELAHVNDGVENDKTRSWYNGTPAIYLGDPAPAGHQHRRGRRRDQGAAAAAPGAAARRRCSSAIRNDRSAVDPRVGPRRQVHAAADRRAWSSW